MGNFIKEQDIFVQKNFKGAKKSYLNDLTGKQAHNPSKMRWYNTFEIGQFMRFVIAHNWMKEYFIKLDRLEQKLNLKKRRRHVADFGCSWSQFYAYWKGNCNYFGWPLIAYYGVDADVTRLTVGKDSTTPKGNDKFKHYLADLAEEIVIGKGHKMDVIICLETLEHMPEKTIPMLLENIFNNLKEDGIAIISSPNPQRNEGQEWTWKDNSRHSHAHEWQFNEITPIFKKHKLKLIKHCGILPRRNFKSQTIYKQARDQLAINFPVSFVNNFLCTIDNLRFCMQWIAVLKKINRQPNK